MFYCVYDVISDMKLLKQIFKTIPLRDLKTLLLQPYRKTMELFIDWYC